MATDAAQIWEVVGGAETGGILVRAGKETSSKQEDTRLSTGALVKELELAGTRLCYELHSGDGPERGWVSTSLKGKDLVTRTEKKPEKNPIEPIEEKPPSAWPFSSRAPGRPRPEADFGYKERVLTLQDIWADGRPAPETWWDRFRKDGCDAKPEPPDPDAPKTGVLPPIVRPNPRALPTLADLPPAIQERFRKREQTIYARMFCFYGLGDSAGQWMQFIDDAPSWCEVIVYECKAHGIRQKDAWDRTYEERAEDAWENLLPSFKQHARGGEFEGAPFALYCHSGGTVPVSLIAQRMRAELALEPLAVYIADQRPPNMPFLNEAGLKMATDEPVKYVEIWQPNIGVSYHSAKGTSAGRFMMERWSIGLLMLEEWYRWCRENGPHSDGVRDTGVYHVFDCPLWVFAGPAFSGEKQGPLPQEMKEWLAKKDKITWEVPDGETAKGELLSWDKWTTKEVTYTYVDSPHDQIWYHFDTEQPIWRSFISLADIHSRMPKKNEKPKRNF